MESITPRLTIGGTDSYDLTSITSRLTIGATDRYDLHRCASLGTGIGCNALSLRFSRNWYWL